MKNKKNALYGLAILLAVVIYTPLQAQQKNGAHRANFSGEWKAKESISMGGNIVCTYTYGDRMRYKRMKIAQQANLLNIEVSDPSPNRGPAKGQEKIIFGKTNEIDRGRGFGKKYTVEWSNDGQTMTINSIVRLITAVPYNVKVQKQHLVYVTEVWKLINNGNSISVQTKAKSDLLGRDSERNWHTIFDKASWYSRFL